MAYLDVCYWDHMMLPSDEDLKLEAAIHAVLFPAIEFEWAEYADKRDLQINSIDPKWRNAKCDVQALWCHIKGERDVFVTNDRNFHSPSKVTSLAKLGAGIIAVPADAARLAMGAPRGRSANSLERSREE
jgi:hypothetical protein